VIQTTRNYKLQNDTHSWDRWLTPLAWLVAAALIGWAFALLFAFIGDREVAKLPSWKPTALPIELSPRQTPAPSNSSPSNNAPWQFVGIADGRVYVRSGNQPMSFAAGDTLPNGDLLRRVEKDAIVVASGDKESRITLFKLPASEVVKTAPESTTAAARTGCRLSVQDRTQATWIEPAVATALSKEQNVFTRIFVPIVGGGTGGFIGGAPGGVRATATGGTTAMFGIQDGDTLLRADGKSLTSGMAVINEVISRLQRGESVVVEGERAGVPKRWVFAPTSCRA
jgi:hypothetical protein